MSQNRSEPLKDAAVRTQAKRVGAGLDTAEKGPARLHAPPGKARPVESGPARLLRPAGFVLPKAGATQLGRAHVGLAADSREAGPPRLIQRVTR
jgi:hypothetical protein